MRMSAGATLLYMKAMALISCALAHRLPQRNVKTAPAELRMPGNNTLRPTRREVPDHPSALLQMMTGNLSQRGFFGAPRQPARPLFVPLGFWYDVSRK